MQDQRTHGVLTETPPAQTYCGLSTYGRKVTHDPFRVDCASCKPIMQLMGVLPNLTAPVQPRGRGRPKKRSLFGYE